MPVTTQTLDPFGYWPNQKSRIKGLGGPDKSNDRNYIFHSNYVPVEPGPSFAEINFQELRAQSGMIALRIFQNLPTGIPQVTEQGKTTALLPSIAKNQRGIRVAFEALPEATYAVTGYVFGECEARANALDLTIGRLEGEEDPSRKRSLFGRWKARRVGGITSVNPPSLAFPVSQAFTQAQTRQEEFAHWTQRLNGHLPLTQQWEVAYIAQVLATYGRMETGARGMGLTMATDPVASLAAAAGCDVTSIVLASGETIAEAMARAFPAAENGRGFDFLWSRSDVFGAGGSERALGLIDELMARLRPGGLGVHMVTLGLGEMDNNALARICLGVAAAGHIAGQLRHERNQETGPVPFGIIVRKTTDSLMT